MTSSISDNTFNLALTFTNSVLSRYLRWCLMYWPLQYVASFRLPYQNSYHYIIKPVDKRASNSTFDKLIACDCLILYNTLVLYNTTITNGIAWFHQMKGPTTMPFLTFFFFFFFLGGGQQLYSEYDDRVYTLKVTHFFGGDVLGIGHCLFSSHSRSPFPFVTSCKSFL